MPDPTSPKGQSPNGISASAIPSINVRKLVDRWGCHRNTINNRAKLLGVDLEKEGYHDVYWPGEYLDLGDQLNAWVKAGNNAQAFMRQLHNGIQQSDMPQSDMPQGAIEQSHKPSPIQQAPSAIQQAAVQQIHTGAINSPADLFAQEELILRLLRMPFGVPEATFIQAFGERPGEHGSRREWKSNDVLRPGVVVKVDNQPLRGTRFLRLEEKEKKAKDSTELTIAPPRKAGFDISQVETTAKAAMDAIDVPFRTITGSSLFAANTIGR